MSLMIPVSITVLLISVALWILDSVMRSFDDSSASLIAIALISWLLGTSAALLLFVTWSMWWVLA